MTPQTVSIRREPLPLTRGGALDALRFAAAFFMVVYHYAIEAPSGFGEGNLLVARGYLTTDFFLVVSGYVLGRIYGERVAAGRMAPVAFFARRAGRVVPAHLIMIAAYVALVGACTLVGIAPKNPEYFDWKELPTQAALLQVWGVPGGKGWNAPTWTLSALLACYLAFPFVWRALGRIRSPYAVLALAFATLAVADLFATTVLGDPVYKLPMKFGLVRALPLFLIGVALARFSASTYVAPALAKVLAIAALAGAVGVQFLGQLDFLTVVLISTLIVAAGAIPVKRRSAVLEKAAIVAFALFITNEFVRLVWFGAVDVLGGKVELGVAAQWAAWGAGLAVSVACAVVFHYVVDMPTQRWIRARRDRTRGRRSDAAVAAEPATA